MSELYRLARRLRRSFVEDVNAKVRDLSDQLDDERDPSRRAVLRRQLRAAHEQLARQRDLADKGR